MEAKKYNGWTNYETWAVNLWLDNDQGTQEYWNEQAVEILKRAKPAYASETVKEAAACELSRVIEDEIKNGEFTPDLGASLYSDLLNAALSEVNWYEIAAGMVEDVAEEKVSA